MLLAPQMAADAAGRKAEAAQERAEPRPPPPPEPLYIVLEVEHGAQESVLRLLNEDTVRISWFLSQQAMLQNIVHSCRPAAEALLDQFSRSGTDVRSFCDPAEHQASGWGTQGVLGSALLDFAEACVHRNRCFCGQRGWPTCSTRSAGRVLPSQDLGTAARSLTNAMTCRLPASP